VKATAAAEAELLKSQRSCQTVTQLTSTDVNSAANVALAMTVSVQTTDTEAHRQRQRQGER